MLKTPKEIIQILMTLNDYYHIKSNSIIVIKVGSKDSNKRNPFVLGFLSSIDYKKNT